MKWFRKKRPMVEVLPDGSLSITDSEGQTVYPNTGGSLHLSAPQRVTPFDNPEYFDKPLEYSEEHLCSFVRFLADKGAVSYSDMHRYYKKHDTWMGGLVDEYKDSLAKKIWP